MLDKLAQSVSPSKLVVFGSVANGTPTPGDIDVAFVGGRDEFAALEHTKEMKMLLSLARQHYGRLDPFVLTGTVLYARNDEATDFVPAKNASRLRMAITLEGEPILDLLARMQAGLPARRSSKVLTPAVEAVCAELGLPRQAVVDLLTLPVEVLRERDRYTAMNNVMTPADFPRHLISAAKIDSINTRVSESYVSYLDEFDSSKLLCTEHEAGIKQHKTYSRYVEMRQQGYEPPYVHVYANEKGQLLCSNRRRTLVAQELGLPLKGWRSTHNFATDLPLKYGDVLAAYARALAASDSATKPALAS
ncbi:hypothetical protein [Paraburkholderia youngii]|uniref:hypothetical protein n=1 Tax=Paraburkholderia youngii TaxID=2782701 RepID=UPI003D241FBC